MQMVQSLQPGDNEQRIRFCEDMLMRLEGNDNQLNNLWMRDEAPPRTIQALKQRIRELEQYSSVCCMRSCETSRADYTTASISIEDI
ncbi:hypothetical protein QE152_g27490 [Popillia japonica]|uniref:Uncharacterized protein n=1 Tax=Popillia japonica TaxID=7064 RepID=A0AAW1JV66_POPJA